MLISLTVGKVDAGVAVLLTEDKRLIEFPSILLPTGISSGSIVDITVKRNHDSETAAQSSFESLQSSIYEKYGTRTPSEPVLRCRNATQTSVVLEWDPIDLATAELRSLNLFRNGAKAGAIPRPLEITSTKISGLAIDTEYNFQLVLRTSAGTYQSSRLEVRTHKMTDLSGITVTPGVLPAQLRSSLVTAVERIGGKLVDTVRIDTTHFVCTEGRGKEWERAVEMNIPVVRPEWIEGCEREGRIVGVRGYYLNADPRLRQVGPGVMSGQGGGQVPARGRGESQASMRPPSTIVEGKSPTTPSNVSTDRMPSPQTNIVPPTPPAKDSGNGVGAGGRSPSQSDDDEEEEEEEDEEPRTNAKSPAGRNLVQSPFNGDHSEQDFPYRPGGSPELSDKGIGTKDRKTSENGSMQDIAL